MAFRMKNGAVCYNYRPQSLASLRGHADPSVMAEAYNRWVDDPDAWWCDRFGVVHMGRRAVNDNAWRA